MCTQRIDKPPNNNSKRKREVDRRRRRIEKSFHSLLRRHAKRRGIPASCRSLERGKCSSSLFLFPLSLPSNATSNGPRPAVLWCPVFRLSVFVRLTSAFPPPLLRHDTRLCRRKTIMYRHNKLFLPSCSCKPSFPGPPTPAWTYFRRSTFFVSRTGRGGGGGGEERFLTKKRRKWKDRGEGGIVARTYDLL